MNTSKQSSLLASLVLLNFVPGLVFPNLTLEQAIKENNSQNCYETTASAVLTSPSNQESGLVTVTAYSSTPEQTDDTPFITASGAMVKDGVVASNFLPFNTKIRFPKLYGNKVFIVKDRMAKKHSDKIDIWFPTTEQAKNFGVKKTLIEIL